MLLQKKSKGLCSLAFAIASPHLQPRGYGATAARLTPDQKVGSSDLSALKDFSVAASGLGHTTLPDDVAAWPCHTGIAAVFRARGGGSNPPAPHSQPVRGGQTLPAATQAASRHNKKTAAGPCVATSSLRVLQLSRSLSQSALCQLHQGGMAQQQRV